MFSFFKAMFGSGSGSDLSPWSLVGQPIDSMPNLNETAIDSLDRICLSGDGTVFAIGEPGSTYLNSVETGKVRVFAWDGTAWVQRGGTFSEPGDDNERDFGKSVSLSRDGTVLAVGSPWRGKVRVYKWNGSAWSQLGGAIPSLPRSGSQGQSVSLNADGTVLAVGDPKWAPLGQYGYDLGGVNVYTWNNSKWTQRGATIKGVSQGQKFGLRVKLSDGGSVVAIVGGPIQVYGWNGSVWSMRGPGWDGSNACLSADGNTIAVSSMTARGDFAGRTRVYLWNGSFWYQRGGDINAGGSRVWSMTYQGANVSMSADGTVVATGGRVLQTPPAGAIFQVNEPLPAGTLQEGGILIHKWNGSEWELRGSYLGPRPTIFRYFWPVSHVCLNRDGTVLGSICFEAVTGGAAGSSPWAFDQTFRVFKWEP